MRIGIICVFKENTNKTQTIFFRTYPAVFRNSCRTNPSLSDISCVFWSFLSDTSSCGHIWLCRTYLAGTRPTYATEMRKRIYASHARRGVYTPRVDLGAHTQTSTQYRLRTISGRWIYFICRVKPGLHFERKSTAHTQTILRTILRTTYAYTQAFTQHIK